MVDMWNGTGKPKTGSTTVSYFLSMNIFKSKMSGSLTGRRALLLYEIFDFLVLKQKTKS